VRRSESGSRIDLIDDARAHGARIIEVGHRPGDAARRPHTLAPTVVLGVTDDMRIAQEEIFGPILPISGYRDIDDAINYVNARPRPLALYCFGDDGPDRRKVLDRTTSGNVTINGTPSCTSRGTTSPSAASAPAGWAHTTVSKASARSATPRASTYKDAGTPPACCTPPSATAPKPSSTSSSDEGGITGARRP
jgi:acyl-CoA reductase-like NAD-dependent aldehyde dehydrogenase